MTSDWEVLAVVTIGFLGGLLQGLWMYRRAAKPSHEKLTARNREQEKSIVNLTALVHRLQAENRKWKECRFHGGEPPQKKAQEAPAPGGLIIMRSMKAVKISG